MSTDSTGSVILDQYRKISSKLKKRFIRKPNVTEACEAFTSLGQYCENEEMPAYAGLCWIAAAQCEGSLLNVPGETACLRRSAQQFIAAEKKAHILGSTTPSQENLHAAQSCYAHAITRYPDNPILTININMEIVETLKQLKHTDKWEMHLKAALNALNDDDACALETRLYCLEHLGCYYVHMGDYVSALDTYTEMTQLIECAPVNAARRDSLLLCEINRVLLLLILKPVPQSLSPNLTKVLEKYTWNDNVDKTIVSIGMDQTLFLLLQSLVLTCQSNDSSLTNSLAQLESELWKYLNADQKDLLRVLLEMY